MHRYLLTAIFLASSMPLTLAAAPFAEPGDPGLRQDLQWLADRGCLGAPVTTWPIMWGSVTLREDRECGPGADRVRRRRDNALRHGGKASLALGAASQPTVLRDFGAPPREEAEATAAVAYQNQRMAGRLAATRVDQPTDEKEWRADGSYLMGRAGNWALAAGAVDRWWGPGHHSSLIWSHNARPVPGVWLNRNLSTAPTSRWLSWVGPWTLTLFAGQLESGRAVPEAKFLAGRLVFRPHSTLELGLSRAVQWGGEGRPEDWDSFTDMLVGKDNAGSSGLDEGEDPGNQRAGLDFRWGGGFGENHTASFYGQVIGEDEAGAMPSKHNWLAGLDWQARNPWGRHLLYLEATDTTAGSLSGEPRYNTAFEHGTYQTGWRYYRRNMASTWGVDTRAITLGGRQQLADESSFGLTATRASFNRDGTIRPSSATALEPVRDRTLWIAAADYRRALLGGALVVSLQWHQEPVPETGDRERYTGSLEWSRAWSF